MANRDYYEVLGISKSATQADIKAAFRKKALEHHPDKGGDATKFKEINEAYQALGKEDTRRQYDQYGSSFEQMRKAGFQGAGFDPREFGFDIGDLSDLFGGLGDIFGFGGRGGGRTPRGRDIEMEVGVDFLEVVHGTTREIEIDKINACSRCAGSSAEPGANFKNCSTCGGTGKIAKMTQSFFGAIQTVTTCHSCHGVGKYPEKECTACHGKGVARGKRVLKVKIPAGIEDGGTIRFAGEGEAVRGGAAGDLYLHVRVRPHKDLERRGNDIWSKVAVPFKVAALGGEVEVLTADGARELKISAGTQSGTVMKLKGLGVAHLRGSNRGDHFVEVHVKVPERLSRHQRKILEEFED
ncbi:molecular chaperone DnaJ [Candidatus Uhrbacteria bacterium]|nr:molecular chaperone DnaJ [Candidatus Uhrbacteria bacterium]